MLENIYAGKDLFRRVKKGKVIIGDLRLKNKQSDESSD